MICQNCQKNVATVHVTEIVDPSSLQGNVASKNSSQSSSESESAATDPHTAPEAGQAAEEDQPIEGGDDLSGCVIHQEHLCEICAQTRDLPKKSQTGPNVHNILKLLQLSTQQRSQTREQLVCPDCGMNWEEFRKRGRLGCPKDYQVFEKPLAELFERMHGSTEHVGRTPGADPGQLALRQRLTELKKSLECAIRDEAYESAAKIRDELRQLETEPPS